MTNAPAGQLQQLPDGMLQLQENDQYFFDAAAADRPVRFIERYCKHYEGEYAGRPFLLHPLQRHIVRDLFGWKERKTGLRRFTDCYFEAAVGAGKSPLLAGLGLYGLMADAELGAQVYSFAKTYGQARVVFDCAKAFAGNDKTLAAQLRLRQFEIRHPKSKSFWRILSGKGPGAGCRPSIACGDEAHEWPGAGAYTALRDRMSKRRQPLMIIATNAGESQVSFCWQLREKAVATLDGAGDAGLYPIIFAAREDADSADPQAWRDANPLIGVTVKPEKIAAKCAEAKSPEEKAEFRRLYLSIWPTHGEGKWLDLAKWDACTVKPPEETPKAPAIIRPPEKAPLYPGVDLSQSDDLSCALYVYPAQPSFYVDADFWIPRCTAEAYQAADAIPYLEWAAAGYLQLVDTPTIDDAARRMIAARILERGKAHPIKAVCYDRYRADATIAALEGAGVTCVAIAQGHSVSPGVFELDRRVKEGSIILAANPVLRFCAENVEVKQDDRGNIWPIKPNARGRYAGKRGLKIDGISALVTALTEARRHAFPAARKMYQGQICRVSPQPTAARTS